MVKKAEKIEKEKNIKTNELEKANNDKIQTIDKNSDNDFDGFEDELEDGEDKENEILEPSNIPEHQAGQIVISKKEDSKIQNTPAMKKKGISGFDMNDYTTTEEEIAKVTIKEIVTMDVKMPSKHFFFTIHPTWEFIANGFKWDGDNNIYIVHGNAVGHMLGLTSKMKFYLGYDENNNHFLLPVTLPDEEGDQNSWHESREKIVQKARKGWLRCQRRKGAAGYDAYPTVQKYPDPKWTEKTKNEIIEIAFADHQINKEDHPIIKSLKGKRFK